MLRIVNIALIGRYARTWIGLALVPALLAGALGYFLTNRQAKTYQASASLFVQQSTPNGAGVSALPDIFTSSQYAITYSALDTQPVVEQAADKLLAKKYHGFQIETDGVSSSAGDLQQQNQVPIISLSVTDPLPQRAADATNAMTTAFIAYINQLNNSRFAADLQSQQQQLNRTQDKINSLEQQIAARTSGPVSLDLLKQQLIAYQSASQNLLTSIEQLRLTRDATSSSVTVSSAASVPSAPTGPHPSRTALLWAFVVLLLGTAAIYGYEYLLDLPHTPEEIERLARAPVLGVVGAFGRSRGSGRLITVMRPRSPAAEAYRLIRTSIQFIDVDHPPRAIVITSPLPHDGKTTTACNLAQVYAEGGKTVTLIDADLRRPQLDKVFSNLPRDGLTNMLIDEHLNGRQPFSMETSNLAIVPSGPLPPNPADLLSSSRMREILFNMRNTSGLVLIDSPPILSVPDAPILSTMADGVILVVDPNRTRRKDIEQARELIDKVGGRVLGVIVNRLKSHSQLYYHYSSYYRGEYGTSEKIEAVAPVTPGRLPSA